MNTHRPFEGVLLVSDMDRTLITEDFKIPRRNIDAIKRFVEKGGMFSLATGRCAESAKKYIADIKINAPSILTNGSSIYDFASKRILWSEALPKSAEEMLRRALRRFPDVGAELYADEKIYIVSENAYTKRHIVNEGFKFEKAELDNLPEDWQKILFAGENSRLRELDAFIQKTGHDGCDMVYSSTVFYEVLPAGVSKGTALHKLAELLGVAHKNTAGIGDYYNDADLVKMSGFGATVEGAPDELIKSARFVAGPCKNGAVADLIEYFEKTPGAFAL